METVEVRRAVAEPARWRRALDWRSVHTAYDTARVVARNLRGTWRDVKRLTPRSVLAVTKERYPDVYAALDPGDLRLIVSFLGHDVLENGRALLGDRPWPRGPASEFGMSFAQGLDYAATAFGRTALHGELVCREVTAGPPGASRWFFINGILNTAALARMSAGLIARIFNTEVVTLFNPTRGLVEDLVESIVQKFWNVNTEPVAFAFVEIARALLDSRVKKVKVLAHSQGTVIAGDVLDLIYASVSEALFDRTNMNPEDFASFLDRSQGYVKSSDLRAVSRALRAQGELVADKLELFMFANAASKMCHLDPGAGRPHIESFANEHDIVPRLGCLAAEEFWRAGMVKIDGPVFVARGQYGHLLNAHYLLRMPCAYQSRLGPIPTRLLAAEPGASPSGDARTTVSSSGRPRPTL